MKAIEILRPGVDTARFAPAPSDERVRAELGWDGRLVVLTVGRLQKRKGHVRMLEAMGLDERAKCNIHVGGAYGDKSVSGQRFVEQFGGIEDKLRQRVTLENDDKTFNAQETLEIAEQVKVPMVLDIHHHAVNDGGIEAVTFGPGDVSECHCANERVSIQQLRDAALATAKVASELLIR